MFDFTKIEDIEIEYEFKDHEENSFYSEINNKNGRVLSKNRQSIRLSIQDDDKANDDTIYQIILKNSDGKIFIKSDFFETPEDWYETSVSTISEYIEIILDNESEKMVLKCYLS